MRIKKCNFFPPPHLITAVARVALLVVIAVYVVHELVLVREHPAALVAHDRRLRAVVDGAHVNPQLERLRKALAADRAESEWRKGNCCCIFRLRGRLHVSESPYESPYDSVYDLLPKV
jgi:hypothetical protein